MDEFGIDEFVENRKKSVDPRLWIIPILAALITGAAVYFGARYSADKDADTGRATAIAEMQPTIDYLQELALFPPASIQREATKSAEFQLRQATQIVQLQSTITAHEMIKPLVKPTPLSTTSVLEGSLTDRNGSPLSGIPVSLLGGMEDTTDSQGKFVIKDAAIGEQTIVVKSPNTGQKQMTQKIHVEAGEVTFTHVIYDAATQSIGLLTIVAPTDGAVLEAAAGQQHVQDIYGQSVGLSQIFDGSSEYEIWLVVDPGTSNTFFIQQQPALEDPVNQTWHAKVKLGSDQFPPKDGQKWSIVAVAVKTGSLIGKIAEVSSMTLLPPHISSNVIEVVTNIP